MYRQGVEVPWHPRSMHDLEPVRLLAERESGLAVAITLRPDGSPRASVVNPG